ncbi:MAG: DNA replication and repair protein RecF [candidate division WS2 bacterium]|nr:DNA replication and repair protein RecF [Candidatus Lithacetigena glycinireducens]MBT9174907.1 DNA replication and repair protein RecF [Candidatus Lithacetigena glycinireducens]
MYIHRVHIRNFRCLGNFEIILNPGVSLFVGENNSGKSTLLYAIDKILGRNPSQFELEDFYAPTSGFDPRTSEPIEIDIELRPSPVAANRSVTPSFSDQFIQDFTGKIDTDDKGQLFIGCVKARYDSATQQVQHRYYSINAAGIESPLTNRDRYRLRSYVPFYLVNAFRDSDKQLSQRGSFWGRLLEAIPVDATLAARVTASLSLVNDDLVTNTPRLQEIKDRFMELKDVIGLAAVPGCVQIHPIPPEPQDLLRNLDVLLQTRGSSNQFRLSQHGEGMRSLAVLTIFRIFVQTLVREENENDEANPILAIEEPEAHLHPHTQRAVVEQLGPLAGQVFVTTHSPKVAEPFEIQRIYLFRRPGPEAVLRYLPENHPTNPAQSFLTEPVKVKLDRYLKSGGAELFFARCIIFFEGDSERLALPVFAKALGINLDQLGITLLPVFGKDYEPYLRILHQTAFNIPWIILSDAEGNTLKELVSKLGKAGYVTQAEVGTLSDSGQLRNDILLPNNCFCYGDGEDFENLLLKAGFVTEYQEVIEKYELGAFKAFFDQQDKREKYASASMEMKIHDFVKTRSKPFYARMVAEKIAGTPNKIPSVIKDALKRAKELAEKDD